jgi:hypothetical protein
MQVGLQEIYDTFNHGLSSPFAIRDFLKYAHNEWRTAPRYVVLAGSATYDYKDYMGLGGNLVPAIMVNTPFGIFASDSALADFTGDGVPQMAIGRLPAESNEELYAQIIKIIGFENNQESWKQNVTLVADNNDEAGDFHAASDQLESLLGAEYQREKIYLGELPKAEARQGLIDAINAGSGLINFVGHGGAERVTAEGLLLKWDVPALTNEDRPNVMVALTCSLGRFEMPGYNSLGEDLVRHDGGGSVAVWAPSGLSIHARATALGEAFFEAVYQDGVGVMGDAILQANESYGSEDAWLSYIYNLMGDPALRLLPGATPQQVRMRPTQARSAGSGTEAAAGRAGDSASPIAVTSKGVFSTDKAAVGTTPESVPASYVSESEAIVRVTVDNPERVGVRIDGRDAASIAVAEGLIFYVPQVGSQVDFVLREAPMRMHSIAADPVADLEAVVVMLNEDHAAGFVTEATANTFLLGFERLPVVLDVTDPLNPRFVLGVEVKHADLNSVYFHLPEGRTVRAKDL